MDFLGSIVSLMLPFLLLQSCLLFDGWPWGEVGVGTNRRFGFVGFSLLFSSGPFPHLFTARQKVLFHIASHNQKISCSFPISQYLAKLQFDLLNTASSPLTPYVPNCFDCRPIRKDSPDSDKIVKYKL